MASEWAKVRLGSLSEVITKGTTPTSLGYRFTETGINYVKSESVTFDGWIDRSKFARIDSETHNALKRSQLKEGDVLFSMAGIYIGKTAVVPKDILPANTNQAVGIVRLDQTRAHPRFIDYFIRNPSYNLFLNNLVSQSAQPNLNLTEIGNLPIGLPPLAEQKAIASILGALDDKIELNRRMNATLEGMARALFQSWFVDFDPVRAKLDGRKPEGMDKATAALFPDAFQESEAGQIPKGWTIGKIHDCCVQIQNGGTPRRNEPRFWDGGNIPWLASGEVRQSIITATEGFITEDGLAESSAKWVPAFSTVVALYGATAGQVSFISSRLTTNQAVCALIPKKDFAFFNYLTMRCATNEMENKAVGSAQQNISKGIVEETQVVLPPITLVERFAELANPLFDRWISNLHQSRTLATLRDTLLPKLLSGELSVAHSTITKGDKL